MNGSLPKSQRAVLFLIDDKGNYEHSLRPEKTLERLRQQSQGVEFISCHSGNSGNFVFVDFGEETRRMALETVREVTGLKCLVRGFSDLEKVFQAVPPEAKTTSHGAMILPGDKGLLHVALSDVIETARPKTIDPSVEILSWPSPQDVLCLYDRSKIPIGDVTKKVLKILCAPSIYGTSRALSVIRDLLEKYLIAI